MVGKPEKTGFPTGWLYELFHYFKNDQEFPGFEPRKIPVLLVKEEGANGQALYLIIEQVNLEILSEPYSHPLNMSYLINDDFFEKAVRSAFKYVRSELLISDNYKEKNIPVFRWYVKPAPKENPIFAIEGPSFYGACGMLSVARRIEINKVSPLRAITCDGDEFGNISKIGGLRQKCEAAIRQYWNIIISKEQPIHEGNNDLSEIFQPRLLRVKTIKEAMAYFVSGVGIEVRDYLNLVYERWGRLPPNCSKDANFDNFTQPMSLRFLDNKIDWDKDISETVKYAVIYGWEKVGKTHLLKHEGRKVSKKSILELNEGNVEFSEVVIPIFLECSRFVESVNFEDAMFATLKAEYSLNGRILSDEFMDLIREKLVRGQCIILIDDFSNVVNNLNIFAQNYPLCKIIITVRQENKKDDYDELPLEISNKYDEVILELLSQHSEICPYKGLQYFDLNDANYFFGRNRLTETLLEKVEENHFLAVLGNSGSGKSSIVRAGLLHQLNLKEGWKIFPPITPAWQNWSPFENLAQLFVESEHVAEAAIEFQGVKDLLYNHGAQGLGNLVKMIKTPRVLLVIDQFEELFTRCKDEMRQAFLDCLLGALAANQPKLCLVIVMRADFHGKWAEYPELSEKIDANSITITQMNEEELEQAIIEPAKKVGLGVEQALVRQMLKDMKEKPSGLPLLQDTLEQLWQLRTVNWILFDKYQSIDGIEGALKKRADEVYDLLSPEEQSCTEWIFMELTQLGDGGAKDTRKQVLKPDLITVKFAKALVDKTLEKLSDARLIVMSSVKQLTVVDVVHEVLIEEWPILRGWIDKNRDIWRKRREIEAAAKAWKKKNKSAAYLLQGAKLSLAEDYLKNDAETVPLLAMEFVKTSMKHRRKKRFFFGSFVMGVILILAGAAFYADVQRMEAEEQRLIAEDKKQQAELAQKQAEMNTNQFRVSTNLFLQFVARKKKFGEQFIQWVEDNNKISKFNSTLDVLIETTYIDDARKQIWQAMIRTGVNSGIKAKLLHLLAKQSRKADRDKINPKLKKLVNLLDKENLDAVIKELKKQLSSNPNDETAWYYLGEVQSVQGKLAQAILSYRKVLELNPNHQDAWNNLGKALLTTDNFDEAIIAFRKHMKLKLDNNDSWYPLAIKLIKKGNLDEAVFALQKLLEIEPKHKKAWYMLGLAFIKQNNETQAIKAFYKQVEIEPNSRDSWYFLASILKHEGRIKEAIEAYKTLFKVSPNEIADSWNGLGMIYYKQKKYQEASEIFSKAISIHPNNVLLLSNDLELALVQGDSERFNKRVLEIKPFLKKDKELRVIVSFYSWLAEPTTKSRKDIVFLLENLDKIQFDWDFYDIQAFIEQLKDKNSRDTAQLFISLFEGKIDLSTLKDRLGFVMGNK